MCAKSEKSLYCRVVTLSEAEVFTIYTSTAKKLFNCKTFKRYVLVNKILDGV